MVVARRCAGRGAAGALRGHLAGGGIGGGSGGSGGQVGGLEGWLLWQRAGMVQLQGRKQKRLCAPAAALEQHAAALARSSGMVWRPHEWRALAVQPEQGDTRAGPLRNPTAQVACDETSGLVASASYDKTLRLWSVEGRPCEVACLQGHGAPVLEMALQGGRVASGGGRLPCQRQAAKVGPCLKCGVGTRARSM